MAAKLDWELCVGKRTLCLISEDSPELKLHWWKNTACHQFTVSLRLQSDKLNGLIILLCIVFVLFVICISLPVLFAWVPTLGLNIDIDWLFRTSYWSVRDFLVFHYSQRFLCALEDLIHIDLLIGCMHDNCFIHVNGLWFNTLDNQHSKVSASF